MEKEEQIPNTEVDNKDNNGSIQQEARKNALFNVLPNYPILVEYFTTMLLSDNDLEQLSTYEKLTPLAKKALEEFRVSLQLEEEAIYEERIKSLESRISFLQELEKSLGGQKDSLEGKVKELQGQEEAIQAQNNSLLEQLDSIQDQVAEERKKAELQVAKIQEEIDKKREELNKLLLAGKADVDKQVKAYHAQLTTESDQLKAEKVALEGSVKQLRAGYEDWRKTVATINNQADEVRWETISFDHPIYHTTLYDVDDYIRCMVQGYAAFTGLSYEDSLKVFYQHSPEISNLLEYANDASILLRDGRGKVKSFESLVKSIRYLKLPVYYKRENKVNDKNVQLSIAALKRESSIQAIALEADSKRRIAEAQLDRVLKTLVPLLPKDIDIQELIAQCMIINPDDSELQIQEQTNGEKK